MLRSSDSNIRLQSLILIVGVILLLAKFTAFLITHSNAILTDALESIVNVIAGSFALYSLVLASKPRDTDHPYGHGKVEFLSAGFEGIMIMIAGAMIVLKAVYNLVEPHSIQSLETGLLITAGAGLINWFMGWVLVRRGETHNSLTMQANGKHLMSDGYTSAGLVLGLILILLTGKYWLDNIVAIIFGSVILITGLRLIRRSIAGVMDEADVSLIKKVIEVLNKERKADWIDVHNLRIINYGAYFHVDCHVTLPWFESLERSHESVIEFENLIRSNFESEVELFIHTDPCLPECCSHCMRDNCPERSSEFTGKIEWTFENVVINAKHSSQS